MKRSLPQQTLILQSHYHTPGAEVLAAFPVVLRAGHLRAAADYAVERRHSPGHDLLFCLAGSGAVQVRGRTSPIKKGECVWINGYEPHAHRANPAAPWELLWLRVDGAGLAAVWRLLGADENPVFRGPTVAAARAIFEEILQAMSGPARLREETGHLALARLVALLRRARQTAGQSGRAIPQAIQTVLNRLTLYPNRPWTAPELARLARMSVPQFYRLFRQATGSSPIDWLRRERINFAKRRLIESEDAIKTVADQAGYNSPYFFSRDFKRYTGQSPTAFRKQETQIKRADPSC